MIDKARAENRQWRLAADRCRQRTQSARCTRHTPTGNTRRDAQLDAPLAPPLSLRLPKETVLANFALADGMPARPEGQRAL